MESENREQRRHPETMDEDSEVLPPARPQATQHVVAKAGNQDVAGVRAKDTGHGKKTADKWNQ